MPIVDEIASIKDSDQSGIVWCIDEVLIIAISELANTADTFFANEHGSSAAKVFGVLSFFAAI